MTTIQSLADCETQIQQAKKWFREKKYNQLSNLYKSIITFKKENQYGDDLDKYYSNLSHVHYFMRQFKEAKEYADKAIETNSKWYKGYLRGAKSCEGMLDKELANDYYKKMEEVIASYPDENKAVSAQETNEKHNIDISIMRQWLLNNGAIIDNVFIEYYDVDYRGMKVNRIIRPEEHIMEIPLQCVVSLEESKTRGVNKILGDLGVNFNTTHTYLANELLEIKYDPTNEKNYIINCLPKFFDNVPINFSKEELKELEGSFALVKIAQKINFINEEYEAMKKAYPEYPFTLKDFSWARTSIITRVYAIERKFGDKTIKDTVMVPFADMANHVIPPNTHWYCNTETDMFVVKATSYLSVGDVLYESYGKKSNYRYFVNYGFTVPNNTAEEVAIILDANLLRIIKSKIYFEDNYILNHINKSRDIFQLSYDKQSPELKKVLDYAKEKCTNIRNAKNQPHHKNDVYIFLIEAMNMLLEGFDTTLEEDEKNLQIYDLSFNVRNCYIQRISEKRMLKHYIAYFRDLMILDEINNPREKKKFSKRMKLKYDLKQ